MIESMIQLFNEGKLGEAITAGNEAAAKDPRDLPVRLVLVQLVCFTGNWDRVDKIVRQLQTLDTGREHAALCNFIEKMVAAETSRNAVWTKGMVPEFAHPPDEYIQKLLWAWNCKRDGKHEEYRQSLDWMLENCPDTTLQLGGVDYHGFRDLDDPTSVILEAHTIQGRYFWIPVSSLASVNITRPLRPIDHLWTRAAIRLTDESELIVFLPGIYFHSFDHGIEDRFRLGRDTEWLQNPEMQDSEGQEIAVGRRTYIAGNEGEHEFTCFDLENAGFDTLTNAS